MSGEVNWLVLGLVIFGAGVGARLIQEEKGKAPEAFLPIAREVTHKLRVSVLWAGLWCAYLGSKIIGKKSTHRW